MVQIVAEVIGTREIVAALNALPRLTRKRALRSVFPKAGRVVAKAGKKTAPKEAGVLGKSLGTKAYTSFKDVGAVVGPRSKVGKYVVPDTANRKRRIRVATSAAGIRALKKGSADAANLVFRRPIKYAHVLELGRKSSARGGRLKARHWLEQAHRRTRSPVSAKIRVGLKDAVERETRKLAARTKK